MTPEQQRIAIAEACPFVEKYGKGELLWRWQVRLIYFDPLNDLNSMHEAEKMLTAEQVREYAAYLVDLCGTLKPAQRPLQPQCTWHATTTRRAEAFLRTLNLWTP
jgi:hypothetical protein